MNCKHAMEDFDLYINRAIAALMYAKQTEAQTIGLLIDSGVTESDAFLIIAAARLLIKNY